MFGSVNGFSHTDLQLDSLELLLVSQTPDAGPDRETQLSDNTVSDRPGINPSSVLRPDLTSLHRADRANTQHFIE